MALYARRPGSDTWHFCSNCRNYPRGAGVIRKSERPTGELCNECKAKRKAGNCR
jgi:hypothetical protein